MRLEQTIQNVFDNFPILFDKREDVLVYIFCVFGNGYKWKNGQLLSKETNIKTKNKLKKGELAEQKITLKELSIQSLYDYAKNKTISFEQFSENMAAIEQEYIKNNLDFEEKFLKLTYEHIQDVRETMRTNIKERMCREYSAIFNLPEDIKEDWHKGYLETLEILKSKNIDIDDVK